MAALALPLCAPPATAQGATDAASATLRATVDGRIRVAGSLEAVVEASVSLEGTAYRTRSDSGGRFQLRGVSAGAYVLRVQRLGFAPQRVDVVVAAGRALTVDVLLARSALELQGVRVVADPAGRARGEAGTASVIEREAIRAQVATSIAGVLELVPGVVLQPPGLDNTQQIALRASPVSGGSSVLTDQDASNVAAFGTALILDGVPLSNNANLQSAGPRAELSFASTAGAGIDLRRLPATTIERVEVIRGIPSVRWGDLTHGAIIVDTRAGAVEPEVTARADATTTEVSLVGGRDVGAQALTLTSNLARTRIGAALGDEAVRVSGQLAHRWTSRAKVGDDARWTLDSRVDGFRLVDDRPESPELPGSARRAVDASLRILERARVRLSPSLELQWTGALERGVQRYWSRRDLVRGVQPLTTRTTPGREIGRFEGGIYNARLDVDGDPSLLYTRLEFVGTPARTALRHDLRAGVEFRRESNGGDGQQFDLLFPPQVQSVGARGFDRPRRFGDLPAFVATSVYADDRVSVSLPGGGWAVAQAGVRVDALHEPRQAMSALRSSVLQPRVNVEVVPRRWVSLRAGAGRLAKAPSLGALHPAPDYYDVVNVNYFANEPSERLAVLTTFVLDPTNLRLRHAVMDRAEAGVELRAGGTLVALTLYRDWLRDGFGVQPEPTAVLRDNYTLDNVNPGSGTPPVLVEPAVSQDSIPVLISRTANNITQRGSGAELTADFPEIPVVRTRVSLQAALTRSSLVQERLELPTAFRDFQLTPSIERVPYYGTFRRTGELGLVTARLIHQQPALGLVITGTVQLTAHERQQNVGAVDSLAFEGYLTRGGNLVPVPRDARGAPEYADLRGPRTFSTAVRRGTPDWLFSLQVAKTLPADGRLSFYAFNAFDRQGRLGDGNTLQRTFAASRFGLEVALPLGGLWALR